jgi:hypothetical protein
VDEITVTQGSITIDEMDLFFEVTGAELEDIESGKAQVPGRKLMRAFALIGLRRVNPDATLADAGNVDVQGVEGMLGRRPTQAAEPPATSPSANSPKRRASRSSASQN